MGDPRSPTAQAILDGAERVLQASGYGAITSRSIAEEAGIKHQLVYYYFQDIDDLLLAAFKRRMAQGIIRLKENAIAEKPLRAIWENFTGAISATLEFEYMALANHHDGVRQEIVSFLTEARAIQSAIVKRVYREKGIERPAISPGALAFLITYCSMSLVREKGIGCTVAHEEIETLIESFLQGLE
jgi:AcrR family transcriptional regulator